MVDRNIEGENSRSKMYFKAFCCVMRVLECFVVFIDSTLFKLVWIRAKSKKGAIIG